MSTENILVLIDVWAHLNSPLEQAKKINICKFLKKIQGRANWKIYHHHSSRSVDSTVLDCLIKAKAINTVDTDPIFKTNKNRYINYYFAGFHANICAFYSSIGINKLLQIADPIKYDFKIIDDLTCASRTLYHEQDIKDQSLENIINAESIDISELNYYTESEINDLSEEFVVLQNLIINIVKSNLILSDQIILD
jgi:hypothetical protein